MCCALSGAQHNDCKGSVILFRYGKVVAGDRVQLGAPSWFAAIANSGGGSADSERLCLENSIIMKVEVAI